MISGDLNYYSLNPWDNPLIVDSPKIDPSKPKGY